MKRILPLGLLLSIASLAACSSSPATVPAPTLLPTESGTPENVIQLTPTSEPIPKVLQAPSEPDRPRQFSDAPDRDLFRLTKDLVPGSGDIPRTLPGEGIELSVGHSETFWLVDLSQTEAYQSDFTLALVTPNAYWYVEDALNINMSGLERSAAHFEEHIYPAVTQVFGGEWNPGIDNDPRLNILNARLSNVAGYFSSTDEYPTAIRPRSNQREIIYINAQNVSPGGPNYAQVLSHELQHAIHWNADASEDTWINEGLAELASSIALNSTFSIRQFLRGAPISLVNWPTSSVGGIANYGAASLFMHFFTEHYGGREDLRGLLAQPEDSIAGIDAYLAKHGYDEGFSDVFRQWAAANVLDRYVQEGGEILGYDGLDINASVSSSISGLKEKVFKIPQYAVEYTEVVSNSEPFQLSFKGDSETALLPVDVGPSGCWWSNSGDSIDSTLSRQVDLPAGSAAKLEYEVWFEIEKDWDYVYVEVSVDGGKSWRIMETPETSPENPIGNGFGAGYTGKSGGWIAESVDLTQFAGRDLWVRFQYVTDDAVNAAGACFRDLRVLAAGITAEDKDWDAQGFVFTDNTVRQDFQVQLITAGDQPQVRRLALDANNMGQMTLQPLVDGNRLIVAVGSLSEKTREYTGYTLGLTPVE